MRQEVTNNLRQAAAQEVGEAFWHHSGRPGQRGGSLPSGAGLADKAIEQGGFTVNPLRFRDRSVRTGFMVSTRPDAQKWVRVGGYGYGRGHLQQAIYTYVKAHWDDIKAKGNYLGAWKDTHNGVESVCLDIATRVKSRAEAVKAGVAANQESIWDVGRKKVVWMPGREQKAAA